MSDLRCPRRVQGEIVKITHKGKLKGDARAGGRTPKVMLRETANFWVDSTGVKYRKIDGWPAGSGHWPMWMLDLETVEKIDTSEQP